jgi:acyl carrier protein
MITEIITNVLSNLGIDTSAVSETTLLKEDLQLDSTETVQISLELKRRLGVSIKLESRRDISIGQICEMVKTQQTLIEADN